MELQRMMEAKISDSKTAMIGTNQGLLNQIILSAGLKNPLQDSTITCKNL